MIARALLAIAVLAGASRATAQDVDAGIEPRLAMEPAPDAPPSAGAEEDEQPIPTRGPPVAQIAPVAPGVRSALVTPPSGETVGDLERPHGEGAIPWSLEIGSQLFAEYRLALVEQPSGVEAFHEFDLPRGWLWLSVRASDVVGRVLLEATRAGGEGSLVGVGGDSLVVRLREAWLGYRLLEMFELRLGIVPLPTNQLLSAIWGMRAVAPIGLRRLGPWSLIPPSDLGATLRFDIPDGYGALVVALSNGEGYTGRELNRGKTWEVAAQLRAAFVRETRPLTLTLAYQSGSTGTGLARADRLVGGLAWDDPRWGLGIESAWVLGIDDRGDREGVMIDAWARVEPIDVFPLLVATRLSHFVMDTQSGATSASVTTWTGAIGVRVLAPLRVFAAVDGRFADDAVASAVPGFERWNVRLVVEGNLAGRFEGSL